MGTNRFQDERHIRWVALRADGKSCYDIGKLYGVSNVSVNVATNKVLADDIKLSGEPEEEVRRAYW